ncbi:helix-turn-helix domain-containing protein [Actinoplanes sp. NPDC026619]|uniref:PucR family transcriptional regulator n=1 Tax=Actinoplanes sp. NPDC026619 TaxID=3155798 RepID=UPI0033DCB117
MMTTSGSAFQQSELGPWMWHRVVPLTEQVVERILAEIPFYRELPREQMQVDIANIVSLNLRMLARLLTESREATDTELDPQRESARHRAEEGVPLGAVLSAYHLGTALAWDEVVGRFGSATLNELNPVLSIFHDYLRALVEAVSASYIEERQILDHHEQNSRRALLAALTDGTDVEAVAQRTGLRPAERYLVLTLAIGRHADEIEGSPGARVAAQRKVRRIQTTFENASDQPVLTLVEQTAGTVLLPLAATPMTWADAVVLIARVQQAAGAVILAGGLFADRAGVTEAIALSAGVADVAARSGRTEGLFRLEDLLLEFQLSRPGPARTMLAARLAGLDDHPDVEHTLRTYLRLGQDRRATANALHLHPNTVDYRLRQAGKLTGLNPAAAGELMHIQAAFISRDTERADQPS